MFSRSNNNNNYPVVLVTGFGQFATHKVNSSAEAVKHLGKIGLDVPGLKLILRELKVTYKEVDTVVPGLINKHDPVLVINVGLSSMCDRLTLEQVACCTGYNGDDNDGKIPQGEKVSAVRNMPKDEKYTSVIDMEAITKSPILQQKRMEAVVSNYAGKYLCDYVYCTSMATNESNNKVLANAFIHVPPLNKPFTAVELGEQLQTVIKAMLMQLKEKNIIDF